MTTETVTVTEAGVYDRMPEDVYHADPVPGGSLSASGAKLLLPPSCPAKYWHERCFPRPRRAFEYGSAAHKLVLGSGPEIVLVDEENWRKKAAQDARDEARRNGCIPLLLAELGEIEQMAMALRKHPVASGLLDPESGDPEQSLFWADEDAGIWRRARLDWLRAKAPGRLIIPDYKTCDQADAASVRRAVASYSYGMQAAQYTDGVRALGLDDDPAFLLIFQEKQAPYLVHVICLEDDVIEAGRKRLRDACEIWRDCTAAGCWPGYADQDITYVSLPPWALRTNEGDPQ